MPLLPVQNYLGIHSLTGCTIYYPDHPFIAPVATVLFLPLHIVQKCAKHYFTLKRPTFPTAICSNFAEHWNEIYFVLPRSLCPVAQMKLTYGARSFGVPHRFPNSSFRSTRSFTYSPGILCGSGSSSAMVPYSGAY